MISVSMRKMAATISLETGKSVQEVLCEIVDFLRSGIVDFQSRRCFLCGSTRDHIKSTQDQGETILRVHRCQFCGWIFHSREKKSIQDTDKKRRAVAKRKATKHT